MNHIDLFIGIYEKIAIEKNTTKKNSFIKMHREGLIVTIYAINKGADLLAPAFYM